MYKAGRGWVSFSIFIALFGLNGLAQAEAITSKQLVEKCGQLENKQQLNRHKVSRYFSQISKNPQSSFSKLSNRFVKAGRQINKLNDSRLKLSCPNMPSVAEQQVAPATNLLLNPGFEENSNWSGLGASGIQFDTTTKHTGLRSLQVKPRLHSSRKISQNVGPVPSNNDFYSALWVKGAPIFASVWWYDKVVTQNQTSLSHLVRVDRLNINQASSQADWKLYENFITSSALYYGKLVIVVGPGQPQNSVFLDDAWASLGVPVAPSGISSPTPTVAPTSTSIMTPTATAPKEVTSTIAPGATPTRTATASSTRTSTPISTRTATRTSTPSSGTVIPTFTATATSTASRTPTGISTPTRTATATNTIPLIQTPTRTATPTRTSTPTSTQTPTSGSTPPPTSWVAPIGVPNPPMDILKPVPTYDQNNLKHFYVDSSSSCSNSNNGGRGSPSAPRCEVPKLVNVTAGSLIVLAGGTLHDSTGTVNLGGVGTSDNPIFYKGINAVFTDTMYVPSSAEYVYIDGIKVDNNYSHEGAKISGANHIVLRNSEVTDTQGGVSVTDGATNVVVYNNHLHGFGDLNSPLDLDENGLKVSGGSSVWVVDNVIDHITGSGIVMDPGIGQQNSAVHHVYVARNHIFLARQSGVWSKQSQDIIYSQNHIHDIIGTSWAASTAMGFQYAPDRIWFIYNEAYNVSFGIGSGSTGGGNVPGVDMYAIGNVIHDINSTGIEWGLGTNSNAGIALNGLTNHYLINNTIYNAPAGIHNGANGLVYISNNIIANITDPTGNHIWIENASMTVNNSLFYQNNNGAIRIKKGSSAYTTTSLPSDMGEGNLTADPGFVNAGTSDFHLQAGSSAIDRGRVESLYSTYETSYGASIKVDKDKTVRPQGLGWDMGAYEFH